MRHPRLASVAVVVAAVVASLAPIAPASTAPPGAPAGLAGTGDEPAPTDLGTDPGTKGPAAAALPRHRTPNPLLREFFANRRPGGGRPEPATPVGALCQQYLGRPNPFRNPTPNVNMIVRDGFTQAGTATGCPTAQNETTIVVNPQNPRNIVAAANDYRVFNTRVGRNDTSGWVYTSFDGGKTWINQAAPKLTFQTGGEGPLAHMDAAGDPALAFGPNNTVYYSNLVFSRISSASGQVVSVSRDGGRTWSEPRILRLDGVDAAGNPVDTPFFNDKNWIAADPLSGTVYVTWTLFTFDAAGNYVESPIVVSKSTDFGTTWSPISRVSPALEGFSGGITPFAQGSNPVVGRDGSLYIPHEASVCATAACTDFEDHDAVVVSTSRNGGQTFTHTEVDVNFNFPPNPATGRSTLTGENFRINSYPLAAYDPITDDVWLTWSDDRNGQYAPNGDSIRTNGDVLIARGRHGENWGETMEAGSPQDEIFPAIVVLANRVAVSYYTRKYDPDGIGLDYAYSIGWGNRIAGAAVRRITTQTSNPQVMFTQAVPDGTLLQGVFIGDYTGLAMGWDFKLHPVWVDFRGNPRRNTPNQDAMTQSISALR